MCHNSLTRCRDERVSSETNKASERRALISSETDLNIQLGD